MRCGNPHNVDRNDGGNNIGIAGLVVLWLFFVIGLLIEALT